MLDIKSTLLHFSIKSIHCVFFVEVVPKLTFILTIRQLLQYTMVPALYNNII